MKFIPWILSLISIVGCFLNIAKSPLCWPIWESTAVGFGLYFWKKKDYGSMILWISYIFFDAYGWWVWTR
ncbi:MAG: hypothetical protein EHM49_03305 [Deltaproteobacteria bacterium]|nr:MAG: hypothetical protein EHM49_03305 [Deltaproteobacteria bacterium]